MLKTAHPGLKLIAIVSEAIPLHSAVPVSLVNLQLQLVGNVSNGSKAAIKLWPDVG